MGARFEGRRFPDWQHKAALARDPARAMIRTTRGGIATVYACPFCREFRKLPKGRAGVGRGYGLGMGGKLTAELGAHIRAEHAAELAEIKAEAERFAEWKESR